MAHRPATARLTPRRRCVLFLRSAGLSYRQIAAELGITENLVRKDLVAVNKTLMRGITDGTEPDKGHRVTYALGLLDAGVDPEEIPDYLAALRARAALLANQAGLTGRQGVDTAATDVP